MESSIPRATISLVAICIVLTAHSTLAQNETISPFFPGDCLVNIREGSVSRPTPITNCSALPGNMTTTAVFNYTLLAGNVNETFSIDYNGTVYQTADVDREKKAFYSIVVLVTSSGGKNDSTYLNITVHDVNDNYPEVLERNFVRNITLSDLNAKKTSFYQIQAFDRDIGKNGELKYTLKYFMPGNNIEEHNRYYYCTRNLLNHGNKTQLDYCANYSLPRDRNNFLKFCINHSSHLNGPLQKFCANSILDYYNINYLLELCANQTLHHNNETLRELCPNYFVDLSIGPLLELCQDYSLFLDQELCSNDSLIHICADYSLHSNETLQELCTNFFFNQSKHPLPQLCSNSSLRQKIAPLQQICGSADYYLHPSIIAVLKLCNNHSLDQDKSPLHKICASSSSIEMCTNYSLHYDNDTLQELCASNYFNQNEDLLRELCANHSMLQNNKALQQLCSVYYLHQSPRPLSDLCANHTLRLDNKPLQMLCLNHSLNLSKGLVIELCGNHSLHHDNEPLQDLCGNPLLYHNSIPLPEMCATIRFLHHREPLPGMCDKALNNTALCVTFSLEQDNGLTIIPCPNNSVLTNGDHMAELCANLSKISGGASFHVDLCANYTSYNNKANATGTDANNFDQPIFNDFFYSLNDDQEFVQLLEFINYEGINAYGNMVVLQIEVTDMGNPQRSTTVNGAFLLEGPCPVQNHTINSTTGLITSLFLCDVQLEFSIVDPKPGEFLSLTCSYLSNLMFTQVLFKHVNGYTRIMDTHTLNITNVTKAASGSYSCKVVTTIGELSSYNEYIDVTEGIYLPPTFGVHTLRESSTAKLLCVHYSVVVPYGLQWFKRDFKDLGRENLIDNTTARVSFSPGRLIITDLELEDSGHYSCSDSESTMAIANNVLIVYQEEQVVNIEVTGYSNPSSSDNCHDVNQQVFENQIKNMTGFQPRIISQEGSNICNNGSCSSSPCLNYGYCMNADNETDGFKCVCPPGFTGKVCEENINECLIADICNNGTCRDRYGLYYCSCQPGNFGYNCQFFDQCKPNSCPKGHTCINSMFEDESYYCYDDVWSDLSQLLQATVYCALLPNKTCQLNQYYLDRLDDLVKFIRDRYNSTIVMSEMDKNLTNCEEFDLECEDIYNISDCEAKFIMHPTKEPENNTVSLPLVWNCPDGEIIPPELLLDQICKDLFKHKTIMGCTSPSGLFLYQNQSAAQLPNSSFTFSMLLIDDNMTILSAEKVMEIMNNNSVQSMLSSFGFNIRSVYIRTNQLKYTTQNDRATTTIAEEVTVDFAYIASTPVAAKLDEDNNSRLGAIVGGLVSAFVILAIATVLLIAIVTIFFYHKSVRRIKRMTYLPESGIPGSTILYQLPSRSEQQGQLQQQLPSHEQASVQIQEHIQRLQEQNKAQKHKVLPQVRQPQELAPEIKEPDVHVIQTSMQRSTAENENKTDRILLEERKKVLPEVNEEVPAKAYYMKQPPELSSDPVDVLVDSESKEKIQEDNFCEPKQQQNEQELQEEQLESIEAFNLKEQQEKVEMSLSIEEIKVSISTERVEVSNSTEKAEVPKLEEQQEPVEASKSEEQV